MRRLTGLVLSDTNRGTGSVDPDSDLVEFSSGSDSAAGSCAATEVAMAIAAKTRNRCLLMVERQLCLEMHRDATRRTLRLAGSAAAA